VLHHVTGDLAGKAVAHHAGRDFALAEARDAGLPGILLHQRFLVLGHHVRGDLYADLALAGWIHGRRSLRMRVAGLAMIVLCVIVLAFKCLRFSGLARFRLLLRTRVLRIVYCVALCCVIQVISLSVPRCC